MVPDPPHFQLNHPLRTCILTFGKPLAFFSATPEGGQIWVDLYNCNQTDPIAVRFTHMRKPDQLKARAAAVRIEPHSSLQVNFRFGPFNQPNLVMGAAQPFKIRAYYVTIRQGETRSIREMVSTYPLSLPPYY